MKRAYVEITHETLKALLDIRSSIDISCVEERLELGNVIRIHLRGRGLPEWSEAQEVEPAKHIFDFSDIQTTIQDDAP